MSLTSETHAELAFFLFHTLIQYADCTNGVFLRAHASLTMELLSIRAILENNAYQCTLIIWTSIIWDAFSHAIPLPWHPGASIADILIKDFWASIRP